MLPSWGPVLLSDTVGFIRDLPHGLIASFKATLEEARQADLLLHVADASNPAVLEQISAVYEVLEELGIEEKDTLLVLNKIDRLADRIELDKVLQRYPNAIPISARTREGFDKLHAAASDALSRSFADLDVETSVANGRMLAYLAAHGEILERQYDDDRVLIHVRLPAAASRAAARRRNHVFALIKRSASRQTLLEPDRACRPPLRMSPSHDAALACRAANDCHRSIQRDRPGARD